MGSAYKNKGVQLLLDGVCTLPARARARSRTTRSISTRTRRQVVLDARPDKPLVVLAFKLEDGRYGQLTYLRVYQGTVSKGDIIVNTRTGKSVKVGRLVRMHADEMEDIDDAGAGDIVALFGIDCDSGDTFTDGTRQRRDDVDVRARRR